MRRSILGITLLGFVLGCASSDAEWVEETSKSNTLLIDHSSLFRMTRTPDGHVSNVVGRFKVQIPDDPNRDILYQQFIEFLKLHAREFGISTLNPSWFYPQRIRNIHDDMIVLEMKQHRGGYELLDSDVNVLFSRDGYLLGFAGILHSQTGPEQDDGPGPAILDEFINVSDLIEDEHAEFKGQYISVDGMTSVRREISPKLGAYVWEVKTPEMIVQLDEQSQRILRQKKISDAYAKDDCSITHIGSGDGVDEIATHTETCGYEKDGDTCTWELSAKNTEHGIKQIKDLNGSATKITNDCSEPEFNATSGSALTQQNAYFWIKTARDVLKKNTWDSISPENEDDVSVTLNAWDLTSLGTAAFSSVSRTIKVSDVYSDDRSTLIHEYGHYWGWSYGGESSWCDYGEDEGDDIAEATAEIIATLVGSYREGLTGYTYSDPNGFPKWVHWYAESADQLSDPCSDGEEHYGWNFFSEPMYELINNVNCLKTDCSNLEFGNDIWVGATRKEVASSILESMAFAYSILPKNMTFENLYVWMVTYLSWYDFEAYENAVDVFQHHGF